MQQYSVLYLLGAKFKSIYTYSTVQCTYPLKNLNILGYILLLSKIENDFPPCEHKFSLQSDSSFNQQYNMFSFKTKNIQSFRLRNKDSIKSCIKDSYFSKNVKVMKSQTTLPNSNFDIQYLC